MRFTISMGGDINSSTTVLAVNLFSYSDEYYLSGGSKGTYNCSSECPENKNDLIKLIETSINACLKKMKEDVEKEK